MRGWSPAIGVGVCLMVGVWAGTPTQAPDPAPAASQPLRHGDRITLTAPAASASLADDGAAHLVAPQAVELVLRSGSPPTGPARLGACFDPTQVDPAGACLRRVEQDLVDGLAWWDRTEGGLRQGWTVAKVPDDGFVRVAVRVDDAVTVLDDGVGVGAAGRGWRGSDLHAWDARGRDLDLWPEPTPYGFALVVDARGAEPPIEVDPTWEPWPWEVEGSVPNGSFASLVRGVGDVNADGFDDVALTFGPAIRYRSPDSVSIYAGGPTGLSTTPEAPIALGFQVTDMDSADVNGDAQPDLVVQAADAVNIWLGNGTFPVGAPAVALRSDLPDAYLSPPMAVAPDINGDGYDDIVISMYTAPYGADAGVRVYFGGPAGPSASHYQVLSATSLGRFVGVGDMDGDGYGEIIAADSDWEDPAFVNETGWWIDHPHGRVQVFRGGPAGVDPVAAVEWLGEDYDADFGTSLGAAGDVNADGLADLQVGSFSRSGTSEFVDLYLGVVGVFPTARSQRWARSRTGNATQCFGCALRRAGDWNGDGYDDVLISDPGLSNGQAGEGRVSLYLGGPAGVSTTPIEAWESDLSYAFLGEVWDGAGDVNGDGFADLILGAPSWSVNVRGFGKAIALLGRDTVSPELPAPTLVDVNASIMVGAGDTNGDGFDDVLFGTDLYAGSAGGLTSPPVPVRLTYPYSMSTSHAAGDVNGDGLADLIFGKRGYAWVLQGVSGAGAPVQTQSWVGDYRIGTSSLGSTVAGVGDVNADGYDDVAISLPSDWWGHDNSQVWILHGSTAGTLATPSDILRADYPEGAWGASLSAAGDVNADGFADVLVGGFGQGQATREFGRVFLGGADGMVAEPLALTMTDAAYYTDFVARSAGDVNGDQYDDVLLATVDAEGSMVGLYLGGPSGPAAVPDTILHEPGWGSLFGSVLVPVGDVNGDGFDDVLVQTVYRPWDHGAAEGSYVLGYWGGPSGLVDEPSWGAPAWMVPASGTQSISRAGDINRDGFDDFLIGVQAVYGAEDDIFEADIPAVTLFYGGPTGPSTAPSGVFRPRVHRMGTQDIAEGASRIFTATVDYGGPGQPTISWDFGDGSPVEQGAQVLHRWADDGTYTVAVTASSPGGADVTTFSVRVANRAPTILSAPDVTGLQGVPVHLAALVSDVPADPLTITWEILGSVAGTGPAIDYVFPVAGAYGVDLTVDDGDGGVTQATVIARIVPNLQLDIPSLARAQPATVAVRGASPGAHVVLLASPRPGAGPSCAPSGAPCVDLDRAVVLGGLTASPTGAGSLRITIPAAARPGATLHFQAIETASQARSAVTDGVVMR